MLSRKPPGFAFAAAFVVLLLSSLLRETASRTVQAEDYASCFGCTESDSDVIKGWSGSGFVYFDGKAEDWIEWTIAVPNSVYDLSISYATAAQTNAVSPMKLVIDGVDVGEFQFPVTGSLQNWNVDTIYAIPLETGQHTFRLTPAVDNVDSYIPIMDWMSIISVDSKASDEGGADYQPAGSNNEAVLEEVFISRKHVQTTLAQGSGPFMEFTYDITQGIKDEQVQIQLFAIDCIQPAQDVSVASTDILGRHGEEFDELSITLTFDSDSLYESNIWFAADDNPMSVGRIELCAIVQLVEQDTGYVEPLPVASIRTVVVQRVTLSSSFEWLTVQTEAIDDQVAESVASVNYLVGVCVCSNEYICIQDPSPVQQNSAVTICLFTYSDAVEINSVPEYTLIQDDGHDGHNVLFAVRDFELSPLTDIALVPGIDSTNNDVNVQRRGAAIRTRLITAFFEELIPNPIMLSGTVFLNFVSDRRLSETDKRHVRAKGRGAAVRFLASTSTAGSAKFQTSLQVEENTQASGANRLHTKGCIIPLSILCAIGLAPFVFMF